MNADSTPNWFDLLLLAMICAGVLRGRKRGMSEELLDFLQWLAIIIGGATYLGVKVTRERRIAAVAHDPAVATA